MNKSKKGVNQGIFFSIVIFILIFAVAILFFTDIFNSGGSKIKQVSLGEDDIEMNISDVKIRDGGIDFILNVDPKKEEIVGVKFIFESEDKKTETYKIEAFYTGVEKSFYSIDLKEIDPNRVNRILMVPILRERQNRNGISSVDTVYNTKNQDYVNASDYVGLANTKNNSNSGGGGGGSSSSTSQVNISQDTIETNVSNQTSCISHTSFSCYAGNVYWYNSCNEVEEVNTLCELEESCQEGQCLLIEESVEPVCGNNILELGEFCDESNLADETCASFGFSSGTISCRDNCQFDLDLCISEIVEIPVEEPVEEPVETPVEEPVEEPVEIPDFITNNIISWWRFENNADDSVGTNDGTNLGATYSSNGFSSGAYDFDGINDGVQIPYSSSMNLGNNGAISLYFNADTLNTGTHNLISYGGSAYGNGYLLNQNGQDLRIYWGDSSTLLLVSGIFSINTWHHVVLSNSNGVITVYVDGNNVGSATSNGEIVNEYSTFIGSRSDDWFFDGRIDELMIFNRALTQSEVTELNNYVGSNSPPPSCISHVLSDCYDGNVYWYDSCGVREEVRDYCSLYEDCGNGVCVEGTQPPVNPGETINVGQVSSIPSWASAELEMLDRYQVFIETFHDRFLVNEATGQTCVDTFYWYNWDDILEGMERFTKFFLIHSDEDLRTQHAQIYKYYHQYAIDQGWIVNGFYNNPYDAEHTVEAFGYLWGAMETSPEDTQLQQWNQEASDALMSNTFYNSDTNLFRSAYLGMDRLGGGANAADTSFNLAFTYPMFKAWLSTGNEIYRDWILDYTDNWAQIAVSNENLFPMQVDTTTREIGPFTGGDWWRFDDSSQLTRFDYDFYGHNVVSRSLHGAVYAQLLADPNQDSLAQALANHLRQFQSSALPEQPYDSYDPAQGGFFRGSSYRYMPALYSASHAALFSTSTQQMIDDYVSAKNYCAASEREHVEWMEFTYQRGLSESTAEYAFLGGASDANGRMNYMLSQPLPTTGDELNDFSILFDGLQYIDGTLWSWSSIRNGAPSTSPIRYFGGDGSMGLPEDVAALIRYYDGDSMELWIYNDNSQSVEIILAAGHYGQNDFLTINDGTSTYNINNDRVTLNIPANGYTQLDIAIDRFVNTPNLDPLE
jgi:hypothetical protein